MRYEVLHKMMCIGLAEPLGQYSCPPSVHWSDDSLEKDLYIESTTVTVLAMDGKRRWLDVEKLVILFQVASHC